MTPDLQYTGRVCVTFWYHMYGASMGTLNLLKHSGTNGQTRTPTTFSVSGDQGQAWLQAKVTVDLTSQTDRVSM
jgi:hypothetical protein